MYTNIHWGIGKRREEICEKEAKYKPDYPDGRRNLETAPCFFCASSGRKLISAAL